MNIKEKFNTLTLISVLANFLTFLMTDKSTNSIMVLVIGLVATIGYTYYANKKYVGKYETLSNDVDNEINKLEEMYSSLDNVIENITGTTDAEKEKLVDVNATLESTSEMVLHNKENTRQASVLAETAIDAAKKGTEEMQEMMGNIVEIKNLSGEIEKIIKVIDDIAFQTNILALNAAVEAARAGEAGKGFAVVADEVRNLAQKSAEAAKNTNAIIEKNIKTAVNSVKASEKVHTSLDEINEAVHKVSELINEITASSEEQADEVIDTKKHIKELNEIVDTVDNFKDEYGLKNIEIKDKFEEVLQYMKVIKGEITQSSLETFKSNEVEVEKVDIISENKTKNEDVILKTIEDNKIETKKENTETIIEDKKKEEKVESNEASKSVELQKIDKIVKESENNLKATEKKVEPVVKTVTTENKTVTTEKVISDAERILPLDDSDGF